MARVRDIVIVGGGVAGWLSALVLGRALTGTDHRITLIETGAEDRGLGDIGPALTLFPGTLGFLATLGLDEPLLIAQARASYALGTAFSDRHDWFLPYGEIGAPIGPVAFHQLAARLRKAGQNVRLADYSLAALAAQTGRFAHPAEDPRAILSTLEYGMHVEREALAELLGARAARLVTVAEAPFRRAVIGRDGAIEAVELADGGRVAGDLFLDCTGADALLVGEALGAGREDWSHWLPCDRAMECAATVEGVPPPFAHVGSHEAGWQNTVPLQGGQGRTFFYASAYLEDARVDGLGGPIRRFAAGRSGRVWHRNAIALGAAAATLEPRHPVALQLLANALRRLIALFPGEAGGGAEAREYERLTVSELERTRDFLILGYKRNGRIGESFWDAARAMAVPEALQYKIDLFAARGTVALYDDELLERPDWIALFDGLGVQPRRYDALADEIPEPMLQQHFARLREAIIAAVKAMPGHGAALGRMVEPVR